MHTAFVQIGLKPGHRGSSFDYIGRLRERMRRELPELSAFFSSGGVVDAVLNQGSPAPINVQVSGSNLRADHLLANDLASRIRALPDVADVYLPQDLDYPALRLNVDRTRAAQLGLSEREVVGNVITTLTSNQMIAPSVWVDPNNNNNYLLTVQYPEQQIKSLFDLRSIPLRGRDMPRSTRLDMVADLTRFEAPTEIDHYQIRRTVDIYVSPLSDDLGTLARRIDAVVAATTIPQGLTVTLRGIVQAMRASFRSFTFGLTLSVVLLYLILVAQFCSFIDPLIILLAFPPGLAGTLVTLWATGTTINIMSLMGVVMLAGVSMSNSILIVQFARHLMEAGTTVREAAVEACRIRLRPILMTSLATLIGLLPMALKLGEGAESYAPLARSLIGGLALSTLLTVFVVPAAFYLVHRNRAVGPALTKA